MFFSSVGITKKMHIMLDCLKIEIVVINCLRFLPNRYISCGWPKDGLMSIMHSSERDASPDKLRNY